MVEGEIVHRAVPGFSDTEDVHVIVHDEIIQYDCFIVEGASVLKSKLEDMLLWSML